MASYEIVNNTSRFPYDYSVITDGDTITYTDTTESQYIIPPINSADANKYLQVNDTATGSRWNTVANELPSQTGNANRLLTTDGTTPSWTATPSATSISLTSGASNGVRFGNSTNTGVDGTGSTTVNIRCQGTQALTCTSTAVTTASSVSFTCGNRIGCNLSTATETRYAIGTEQFTGFGGAVSTAGTTGTYSMMLARSSATGSAGSERFRVNGAGEALLMNGTVLKGDGASSGSFSFANGTLPTVNRLNISDLGTATEPTLTFGDLGGITGNTGPSGIYANPVDNTINFCTNSTERFKVDNGGVQAIGYCVASGPIVGSYLAPNTGGSVTGQGIRLKNDNYRNHQGIFCGATGTIGFSTTQSGDTGATASERVRINDSGLTVFGNIDVSGDVILGNKIRPQVGYLASNSAVVTILLSDVINDQFYIVNLTRTAADQTVDIQNDLSITHNAHFIMYFYGTSTQLNTISITGNFGVGNHKYISNFGQNANNVTSYTSTEPNLSRVEFTYYYNSGTATDSLWIINRTGPLW